MRIVSDSVRAWRDSFLEPIIKAKGFRDRVHHVCLAALVLLEVIAVIWVISSYRFESIVPVYQQF